jgi:hypothetical protein
MKHLVVFTAFDRTTSDGLSFDLSSTLERQGTEGVVPNFVNWLNTYTAVGGPYGYTYQRITGTSQTINLKLSTTLGQMQRYVASDVIDLLAGNATWTATASGATFSVPVDNYVAFRNVGSKLGTTLVSVLNASDNDTVLDTFNVTIATESLPPPEYQPEFASYGTGWGFMSAGAFTGTVIVDPSIGTYQLVGSFTHTDPDPTQLAGTNPIFGGNNTTGKLYFDYTFDNNKTVLGIRPSSDFGGTSVRAQNFINAYPNSYLKVYIGNENVYGNRYRLFTNPVRYQTGPNSTSTEYVRYTAVTEFPNEFPYNSGVPFRLEFYTS